MRYSYLGSPKKSGTWKVKNIELEYTKDKPSEIIGDIYKKSRSRVDDYLDFEDTTLRIEPPVKKIGFFTKVVGYVYCVDAEGQKGYVRILKKATLRISTIIALLIVLLGSGLGYYYVTNQPVIEKTTQNVPKVYGAPQDLKNDDPTQIAVPTYDALYVDAKTQKFQSPLINVTGNQCLMKYSIINKQTGETIFSTDKLLKPGKAFYNFKPNKALLVGEYSVYVKIDSYSLKNPKKQLNSSSIESQVIVQ